MTTARRPGLRALVAALTLLFATAGWACDGAVGPGEPRGLPDPNDGNGILVAFGDDLSVYPEDDWELVSGEVVADSLRLEVQYSGGCADHDFWLLAVHGWTPLPDGSVVRKVGVDLLLPHEDHDDACDALLTRTLQFDLSPLGDAFRREFGAAPGGILLQLTDGRDGFATYVFDWPVPSAAEL